MNSECPCCGRTFSTKNGMGVHKAQAHNRIEPWEDETTMRYLYIDKRMSSAEIAEVLPCNKGHVKRWLRRHGIQRTQSEAAKLRKLKEPPHYRTHQGHSRVCTQLNGQYKAIGVHRLVAVAHYGFDAVDGKEVHHKNGIGWDNRPENLEIMTKADHARYHYYNGDSRLLGSP